jgi:methylated-DNA-[protein]-cysteine S-methyltransferase
MLRIMLAKMTQLTPVINPGLAAYAALADTAYQAIITSPIGPIGLRIQNEQLATVDFLAPGTKASIELASHDRMLKKVIGQLRQYFQDPSTAFDIPCLLPGTAFQQRVWQALASIPPGSVYTYGQLAKKLNTGPRAIGQACRSNPVPIIIPCHRIIAAQQQLGGYSGFKTQPWLTIKAWLLQHEKAPCTIS